MDILANKINGREVRKACQNLPKDTSEIYDETMKRVEGQTENRRTLAKHVFSWVIPVLTDNYLLWSFNMH